MKLTNTLLGLAIATTAVNSQTGTTIRVAVGEGGVLQYSPNNITAKVGTAIEFNFFPNNHSVVQSSFANPCHPLPGGFSSSFISTKDSPSGTSFTVIVSISSYSRLLPSPSFLGLKLYSEIAPRTCQLSPAVGVTSAWVAQSLARANS